MEIAVPVGEGAVFFFVFNTFITNAFTGGDFFAGVAVVGVLVVAATVEDDATTDDPTMAAVCALFASLFSTIPGCTG